MVGIALAFGARFAAQRLAPQLITSGVGKFLLGNAFKTALTGIGLQHLLGGGHRSMAAMQMQQYRGFGGGGYPGAYGGYRGF